MKRKKVRDTFELEVVGGMTGGVILILAIAGVLDFSQAAVFFTVAIGFGAVLNGLISTVQFWKKNYILGSLFFLITLALIVLLILQITILMR